MYAYVATPTYAYVRLRTPAYACVRLRTPAYAYGYVRLRARTPAHPELNDSFFAPSPEPWSNRVGKNGSFFMLISHSFPPGSMPRGRPPGSGGLPKLRAALETPAPASTAGLEPRAFELRAGLLRDVADWLAGGPPGDPALGNALLQAVLDDRLPTDHQDRDHGVAALRVVKNIGTAFATTDVNDVLRRHTYLELAVGEFDRAALRDDYGFTGLGRKAYERASQLVGTNGVT